jgi:hypothetical protein
MYIALEETRSITTTCTATPSGCCYSVAVANAVVELCILQGRQREILQQHAQLLPAGVAILWLLTILS